MSLDVSLTGPEYEKCCRCPECGYEHKRKVRDTFYDGNITHNLAEMARHAGLYECCWHPPEGAKAGQLIQPLREGLARLIAEPTYYRQWNPPNKWGNYEGLVEFVRKYLDACKVHPDADVGAWT